MAVLPSSMYTIFPSLSTTKVERFAMPFCGIRTPYAAATFRSKKSLNSGNEALSLVANSFWEGLLSVLMPKTLVSLPSNFAIPAWYAVISRVQPPVKAAGKNASTTVFFPRKLESVTFPP